MYYGAHSPEKHTPLKCFFLCCALSVYMPGQTQPNILQKMPLNVFFFHTGGRVKKYIISAGVYANFFSTRIRLKKVTSSHRSYKLKTISYIPQKVWKKANRMR